MRALALAALLGVGLAGAAVAGAPADAPKDGGVAAVHHVAIRGMQFVPQTLQVAAGDEVVFTNEDMFAHTATAADKQFDSGEIKAKGTWRWRAKGDGAIDYVCTYHPTMKGTIVVK